ncbi:MAG TPA: hypothetical protein PLZ36_03010 [Armatimonadota bacterium]|nr:hypothetical protein [Armatimonadota bacterium]
MRILVMLATISLLAFTARAATLDAPVLAKEAGAAYVAQARASGRCVAADVDTATKGVLLNGSSRAPLAPGRYRLHVPLALAPLADLRISEIAVILTAERATRAVKIIEFPAADEFTDLTLDFTAANGPAMAHCTV